MSASNVDLSIHVNGNAVATYQHEGKTFVEAREGTQYHLHVKNRNAFRIKAVLSVDGVNVINGEPATGDKDETGYILGSYESQTIKGYRLDDNSVAAFKFVKAESGYATAEKNLTGTTGVIGCRVFREKEVPLFKGVVKEVHHHYDHWYWGQPTVTWTTLAGYGTTNPVTFTSGGSAALNLTATSFGTQASQQTVATAYNCCSTSAAQGASLVPEPQSFDAGSTFGDKVDQRVTSVTFGSDLCLGEIGIYYAFRAGLQALGIDLTKTAKVAWPTAFSGVYAKPPKGWVD